MEEHLLSLSEVAETLEKSERTIRRWIKSGKLKAYKPGRDYLIPESAIRELIEGSEVYPKVQAPLFPPDNVQEPRREALQEHVEALGQKRKRDLALAAKGYVSDFWLGATSAREARDVKQLAEAYGVEVEDVLEVLVQDTPGLAETLDRFEERARELAAKFEQEIAAEFENDPQQRDLA